MNVNDSGSTIASLSAGVLLIAPGTPHPPKWLLENDSAASGWSRVVNASDRRQLEKELDTAGWTLFLMAGVVTATSFGLSGPRMFDAALTQLQLAVALELHRRSAAAALVASDKNLCEVATVEGMQVVNPMQVP